MDRVYETLDGDGEPQLKITPLIDVIFLLLIFFIITMKVPKSEQYLSIFVAQTRGGETETVGIEPYAIRLMLDENGRLVVQGRAGTDFAASKDPFEPLTRDLIEFKRQGERFGNNSKYADLFSRATIFWSPRIQWGHLVRAMEACKKAQVKAGFREIEG